MNERLIDDEPKQPPQLRVLDLGLATHGLVCDVDDPDCAVVGLTDDPPGDPPEEPEAAS